MLGLRHGEESRIVKHDADGDEHHVAPLLERHGVGAGAQSQAAAQFVREERAHPVVQLHVAPLHETRTAGRHDGHEDALFGVARA